MQQQQYASERRKRLIAAGLCPRCGLNPKSDTVDECEGCRIKTAERNKQRIECRKKQGICFRCCGKIDCEGVYCTSCKNHYSELNRQRRNKYKDTVYEAYGGYKCSCCGESNEAFLSIDHINNDGAEHRKKVNSGSLYKWLIENKFPSDFQILCMNCQWGKRKYGICPHQQELCDAL